MLIKEFCPARNNEDYHFVIRESDYGSQLAKFLNLFEIAKADFPELQPHMVRVIKYGGERYGKTFGIEFALSHQPPEDYKEIAHLEDES
jgi:hypothetical protein